MNEENKLVLLVEDEVDLVDLYTEILTEAGFEVISAYDGAEGLVKAKNEPWQILLLDIMLPEKDGMSVLEELKSTNNLKGPVVLLTNLNSEDLIARSYSLGASDYLIKSEISLQDIVKKVEAYLN